MDQILYYCDPEINPWIRKFDPGTGLILNWFQILIDPQSLFDPWSVYEFLILLIHLFKLVLYWYDS